MNVLVVAAHPDDEVFGLGATIKKLSSAGHDVFAAYLCRSVKARKTSPSSNEIEGNIQSVQKILGIKDVDLFDFPNIQFNIVPSLEIVQAIESSIVRFKPEVIFSHHYNDLNEDHRIAYAATITAAKLPERRGLDGIKANMIRKILCYEIPSSTNWSPKLERAERAPDAFVDISDQFDAKVQAMKVYDRELRPFPHPLSLEAMKLTAKMHGGKIHVQLAEAFHLVRELF